MEKRRNRINPSTVPPPGHIPLHIAAEEQVVYGTGARESQPTVRMDLIPPIGLLAVGRVAREGAEKYGERNWEKGIPAKSMINHAIRHLVMYISGDRTEDHLSHAAWRCLAAIDATEKWPELDTALKGGSKEGASDAGTTS